MITVSGSGDQGSTALWTVPEGLATGWYYLRLQLDADEPVPASYPPQNGQFSFTLTSADGTLSVSRANPGADSLDVVTLRRLVPGYEFFFETYDDYVSTPTPWSVKFTVHPAYGQDITSDEEI